MITALKKIKSFGVFDNYSSSTALPAFARYNIIYGENGAGKTTLSRLFSCLENGAHGDYPNLEYAVESESGPFTHGQKYGRRVRVFNSDYVEANIGRFDGPLRHILILGEENKALAKELKAEIATRDERRLEINRTKTEIDRLLAAKGKIFSAIAKTIGEATSGATLRSYRKPDAAAAFAKLKNTPSLSEEDLTTHRATIRQDALPSVEVLRSMPPVMDASGTSVSPLIAADGAAERARLLVQRSAQSATIERLTSNPDIARWVEEGIALHAAHDESHCEYCAQPISRQRLQALANHFSAEDQRLKNEIDQERIYIAAIRQNLHDFAFPDTLALYSELREEYDVAVAATDEALRDLIKNLDNIDAVLSEKLNRRTTSYQTDVTSDTLPFSRASNDVMDILRRHNIKTERFDKEKAFARNAIEFHYLKSIKPQVDDLIRRINTFESKVILLENGDEMLEDPRSIIALSASIAQKQVKVSNAHAGGVNLTEHLKQFLGRTDLQFQSGDEGYRVLRRGKPARRLSEGEKTAIAFLYFLVQLRDQDFDIEEGIVVIDDPISSLDASAIYQAFSFLKNETQKAKQLFILTHNFEFLRLLINWIKNIPSPKSTKSYSMVLCSESENGRTSRIAPLDNLLIEHATEYHYLFKTLYSFKSDGTIQSCYHLPNIARKLLETFLDFYLPSNKSLYQKLEATQFEPHKKTAIYKFANDLSHYTGKTFDPALVSEAQKNVSYLLEMIATVAPLHYQGLEALVKA
ncbi:AAA family ATPase [Gluconobacter kondonii]|uniref:AAA family ATPase n=1 Tax=Gluconobacter kondonii TaxID=941463 RepID=UPI001B8BA0FA|nr:AAA family ATPase [Gluconobacter kondonii]MBS1053763.1 AAA family ATPase [Gluconobacter kondonii]MCP1236672.1 AAA family ATPase [Gluconobacter kondonii]